MRSVGGKTDPTIVRTDDALTCPLTERTLVAAKRARAGFRTRGPQGAGGLRCASKKAAIRALASPVACSS
jgi:hypothetical protein